MRKTNLRISAAVSALMLSPLLGASSLLAIAVGSQSAYADDATTAKSYLVFFDFNKSDLSADAVKIVDQAAADAAAGKVTSIQVTGYTDTVGSDAYNMRLSKRRAMSVQAELTKQGIPEGAIAIFAKGKHDLLVPTKDGVKEPQNRRALIAFAAPAAAPAAAAPAAPAAAAAAPACGAMTTPAMSASLAANCNPMSFDLGGFLGKTYVTGVVSGLFEYQNNVAMGDRHTQFDLSNGQVFVQKTDGQFQYFIEAGAYSIPTVGVPYVSASTVDKELWSNLPVAYAKWVPTDTLSFQVGRLPTLIGAEYAFTFQNLNIERGLLWNQEPAISQGIQANYTIGPVAASVSLNDGLYSNRYNQVSGLVTWTIDPANTLAVDASGNVGHTGKNTFSTPIVQDNQTIFNVMYTHTDGPWTFNPYFQYATVSSNPQLGFTTSADNYAFALLVNYAFDSGGSLAGFSLPARFEYINTTGNARSGAPNFLYGPGSSAFSITVTPTYQNGIFFGRAELSYVNASSTTPGFALGASATATTQTRALLEAGIIF